eukprot:scaffold29666_cov106-Isochrysis_galbana.AAC.6
MGRDQAKPGRAPGAGGPFFSCPCRASCIAQLDPITRKTFSFRRPGLPGQRSRERRRPDRAAALPLAFFR